MTGQICALVLDKGFGFIDCHDHQVLDSQGRKKHLFHMSSLDGDMYWDERLREMTVEFDILETAKGPRAESIRPARP